MLIKQKSMHLEKKVKPFWTVEEKYHKSQIIFKKSSRRKKSLFSNGLMRSNEFFSYLQLRMTNLMMCQ